ncbi:proline-rich protein 2-like [Paramacrobiotus metropolitanus]|uniref:proline-rich protein 2-like n=1 Tax=Paramacrobiotus metropolitanus TaxID=2943436 RepID=UPI002445F858|nr:proline-rich protein 2-like [Paramacrobiotus metropolitanus]
MGIILWPVILVVLISYFAQAQDFGGPDLGDALTAVSQAQLGSGLTEKAPSKKKATPKPAAAKALNAPAPAPADNRVVLTSPGDNSGFRRAPPKGSSAASDTLFPSNPGAVIPRPVADSILTTPQQAVPQGAPPGGGAGGGAAAGSSSAGTPPGGAAGAAGAAAGPTTKPPPATTFAGYLVGSPYPFVLPPPDIPYFGSKWNGPWGYPVGHYQAFRGTGQYITHYSYYPLSYFGSLMAPFAYGVSGKR